MDFVALLENQALLFISFYPKLLGFCDGPLAVDCRLLCLPFSCCFFRQSWIILPVSLLLPAGHFFFGLPQ